MLGGTLREPLLHFPQIVPSLHRRLFMRFGHATGSKLWIMAWLQRVYRSWSVLVQVLQVERRM
jgi:hypothetical protein